MTKLGSDCKAEIPGILMSWYFQLVLLIGVKLFL